MSITILDCSPAEFAKAISKVLSESGPIQMKEPELLLKLRRAGGLFSIQWPEEEPDGQTEG
jgi:hypothetical protein